MAEPTLRIRIVTPRELLYNGEALSVSSTNSAGNFDILPQHANFITIVKNEPIVIRLLDDKKLTFNFPVAIIFNTKSLVNIYTDISLK